MGKIKKEYKFKDWILDSQGEVDFCYYLQELQDNEYINHFKRPISVILSHPLVNDYKLKLKTKTVDKKETLLHGHEYTWDFSIDWTLKGYKYFCNLRGQKWTKPFLMTQGRNSYIENKPSFDFNNMTRLVTLNIKWVWAEYGIFIQIVKNNDLFKETFVPKALLTTKTGKKRVFKFPIRTLEEYIKQQENGK